MLTRCKNLQNRFNCVRKMGDRYIDIGLHEVLCLVIVNKNVTMYVPQKCQKYQTCRHQNVFFQAPNAPKPVFGQDLRPGPRWGAYDAPSYSLSAGKRTPPLYTFPLDAFGVSILVLRPL